MIHDKIQKMCHNNLEGEKVDYISILKQAYSITAKNKFLWIFGLFAGSGLAIGLPNFFDYRSHDYSEKMNLFSFSNSLASFWEVYSTILIAVAIICFILGIFIFILKIASIGGIISSTARLSRGEQANFKTGFKVGLQNFWRIIGLAINYFLLFFISASILLIPIALFIISRYFFIAVMWGVLMLIVCLIFWILIAITAPYAYRHMILEKAGVWQSLRQSVHILRENLGKVLVTYLILVAIGYGWVILLSLAFFLLAGLLSVIGYAIWLVSGWATVIYAVSVGIALLFVLVVINGIYATFNENVLTLTYLRLKKG